MTSPEELWGTSAQYQLVDLRGKHARMTVPARTAPTYLVVHRGRVSWTGRTAPDRCGASTGETVEIAPGDDVEMEATDAVCEYFAHPEDVPLQITAATLSEVEVTVR
jgi:hypothetical protein